MAEGKHAEHSVEKCTETGRVEVDGEVLTYTLFSLDVRSAYQRLENAKRGTLDGDLNVFLPGHGQSAAGARRLLVAIAESSMSKVVWSMDIGPPRGGDPTKAKALVAILREKGARACISVEAGDAEKLSLPRVTVFGWSHGGADALRVGEEAPGLVRGIVTFCPAGLTERAPSELAWSFVLECARTGWRGLLARDWTLRIALGVLCDVLAGMIQDAIRSKSLRPVVSDICWAARKVVGAGYRYSGPVVIVFGRRDTVIRWRDVFPGCRDPAEIGRMLDDYKRCEFPQVSRLEVQVLGGDQGVAASCTEWGAGPSNHSTYCVQT